MDMSQLNIWAVLVAALASFSVGSLWYKPVLFGNAWMEAIGTTQEEIENKGHIGRTFGFAFLATLMMSFCLAMFFGNSP